jgi:tRNA (cytidine/uridine-2'-O-)-methyltransferase
MDYAENVRVTRHSGWSAFREGQAASGARLVLLTTAGSVPLHQHRFRPDDVLLFGRESSGVPHDIHNLADARVVIPLSPGARSLNVAMSAGIALWEALKQTEQLPAD